MKKIILVISTTIMADMLKAQVRVPTPVVPGAGRLIPDWIVIGILGIIGLVIAIKIMGWLVSCFTEFKSFLELLTLLLMIGTTWATWEITHWNFWWCLLVGFSIAATAETVINNARKKGYKK